MAKTAHPALLKRPIDASRRRSRRSWKTRGTGKTAAERREKGYPICQSQLQSTRWSLLLVEYSASGSSGFSSHREVHAACWEELRKGPLDLSPHPRESTRPKAEPAAPSPIQLLLPLPLVALIPAADWHAYAR